MNTNVSRLAEYVAHDIRTRGLKPGDRYLTTTELGEQFDVSPTTAHRALKLLAERDIVTRRQHRGTFVGPRLEQNLPTRIPTVCVLRLEETRFDPTARMIVEVLVKELESQMPEVDIHLGYVPSRDSDSYVRGLLNSLRQMGELAGVLALSCTREVYRLLADEQVAAVVLGSLYADQQALLPSMDIDNHEAGRLLVHHLVAAGHRRIAMLPPPTLRPGDNDRFAGISHAMTALQLPHNALQVHSVPHEDVALTAITESLLASKARPTGFIVWGRRECDTLAATIAKLGLRRPQDVEIVYFNDDAADIEEHSPYACVRPMQGFETCYLAAKMLKQLSQRETLQQDRVVIPVQLIESRS